MRRALSFLAVALFMLSISPIAVAEGDVNLLFGIRRPKHEVWDPVDKGPVLGIAVDWGRNSWPIRIAVGYQEFGESGEGGCFIFCTSPDQKVQQTVEEFYSGVVKYWKPGKRTRFYWGGGLTWAKVEMESTRIGPRESDNSLGLYSNAAIVWLIGGDPDLPPHFNLGLEVRYVSVPNVELFGESFDADYLQYGMFFGVGW